MLSEYHRDLLVVTGLALAAAQTLIAFIALFIERQRGSNVEKINILRLIFLSIFTVFVVAALTGC